MIVHARFVLGALTVVPVAPLLVWQGRRVRATVPSLPEAREPEGEAGTGTRPLRLLVLGESTMAGVGVSRHADGFAGHLAAGLASHLDATVRWSVFARNGVTAADVADELIAAAAHLSPDLIVVGLGANDTFQANPTWRWQRDVRRLLGRARDAFGATPIVFAQLPPIHQFPAFPGGLRHVLSGLVRLHGRALRRELRTWEGVWLAGPALDLARVPEDVASAAPTEAWFADGVHPSGLTYRLWAEDVARFVAEHPELL